MLRKKMSSNIREFLLLFSFFSPLVLTSSPLTDAFFPNDLNQWTHSAVLDVDGDVVLQWQPRHQEVLFRVEARTRGYVGLGFSASGGMTDADIVIGWVDDRSGRSYLLDCHGVPKEQGSAPVKDAIDNYTLMRGLQNDTHTAIEFRRVLDTCDPDDYVLTSDTVRVIWALHEHDPRLGAEMLYHGTRRGSQSLHLLGPPPIRRNHNSLHTRSWDVLLKNFKIRNDMSTMYWCKIFKAPTLQEKHHIIGYEPIIGSNHSGYVHHMILSECHLDSSSETHQKFETHSKNPGNACYEDASIQIEFEKCMTPVIAWAIGSKGENFPPHVGVPLPGRTTYYRLEVHFDNPSMKKSVDTTGLKLFYTNQLRENEAGMLSIGVTVSPLHFIPPQQVEYKSAGYCSTDCTKEGVPRTGINVVSVVLHSHLAGRKLRLRHLRGGKELQPIVRDDGYDFEYQQARALGHEAVVLPGDGLVMECTYGTKTRRKPTFGGYSTMDEMCIAFVLHYPKAELSGCFSMPPIRYFFESLGVREFYGRNMSDIESMFHQKEPEIATSTTPPKLPLFPYNPGDEMSPEANIRAIQALKNAKEYTVEGESNAGLGIFDKLIIKEPQEFRNKSFMQHLQDLPYNESLLTKKIEEYFYTGLHLTTCTKRSDTFGKDAVERFPNFTAYEDDTSTAKCSYKYRVYSSSTKTVPSAVIGFLVMLYVF